MHLQISCLGQKMAELHTQPSEYDNGGYFLVGIQIKGQNCFQVDHWKLVTNRKSKWKTSKEKTMPRGLWNMKCLTLLFQSCKSVQRQTHVIKQTDVGLHIHPHKHEGEVKRTYTAPHPRALGPRSEQEGSYSL